MSDWQPLSVRRGQRPPREEVEGIPPAAKYPLRHWAEGMFGYRTPGGSGVGLELEVAAVTGMELQPTQGTAWEMHQILEACERDDDVFLDVLDAILHARPGQSTATLDRVLRSTGSVWAVNEEGDGLVRRVDPTAEDAYQRASSPEDAASSQLREAWALVYGREADPSDAWDHAIKAVEELLIPIVVPKKKDATLGDVRGILKSNSQGFGTQLGQIDDVVRLIELIWPNPDRHGAGKNREPTSTEAEAAVQIAVLLVQWARRGFLAAAPGATS